MKKKTASVDASDVTPTSWEHYRQLMGLPESKRIKARNTCFDCGETLTVGACGGWHCRVDDSPVRGGGTTVTICCKCRGCNG